MQKQKIAIVVRRGGPNQEAGLTMLRQFLTDSKIVNEVSDPSQMLHDFARRAKEYL